MTKLLALRSGLKFNMKRILGIKDLLMTKFFFQSLKGQAAGLALCKHFKHFQCQVKSNTYARVAVKGITPPHILGVESTVNREFFTREFLEKKWWEKLIETQLSTLLRYSVKLWVILS